MCVINKLSDVGRAMSSNWRVVIKRWQIKEIDSNIMCASHSFIVVCARSIIY